MQSSLQNILSDSNTQSFQPRRSSQLRRGGASNQSGWNNVDSDLEDTGFGIGSRQNTSRFATSRSRSQGRRFPQTANLDDSDSTSEDSDFEGFGSNTLRRGTSSTRFQRPQFGRSQRYGQSSQFNRQGRLGQSDQFDQYDQYDQSNQSNQYGGQGFGRNQSRWSSSSNNEKQVILAELIEDAERDEFQHMLIKQLIKSRKVNLNRNNLCRALLAGEPVPRHVIGKLLCHDMALDHVTDKVIQKIVDEGVQNRNSEAIIESLERGVPHCHQGRQVQKQNAKIDNAFEKIVLKLASPNVINHLVETGIVDDLTNTLCSGADFGSRRSQKSPQYGNRSNLF